MTESKTKPVPVTYEKPKVADYGDLRELTAGGRTGARLDADFQTGTLFSDLTFS